MSCRRQVININNVLVEETNLHRALWQACAGKSANIPKEGDEVVYFLQPHIDEVRSYAELSVLVDVPPNIPAAVFCTVTNVQLVAEPETDEVVAILTLIPRHGGIATKPEQGNVSSTSSQIHLFSKTLTVSDVRTHGGYTIPNAQAQELLPHMEVIDGKANQTVTMYDLHGKKWTFRHAIRGNPKRHSFTTGWSKYVHAKRLIKDDTIVYLRDENGDFRIGVRRSRDSELRASQMASIISGQSLQLGLLATVANALHTQSMFSVYIRPWRNHSSFLVPLHKYLDSFKNDYPDGARFRMTFENDECGERRFNGRIDGTEDLDPVRWPGSKWKCLKVTLDSDPFNMDCPYKPERVSPWEIELILSNKKKYQDDAPSERKKLCQSNIGIQWGSSTAVAGSQGQSSSQGFFPSTPMVGPSTGFGLLYKPKSADENENEPKFLNPPRFKSFTLFGKNIVGEELPSQANTSTNHHTPTLVSGHPSSKPSDNLGDIRQSSSRQQEQAYDKGYNNCLVQVIKYNTTLDIRSINLLEMSGYDHLIREIDAMFGFAGGLRDGSINWYMKYIDANGYIVGECMWNEFVSVVRRIDVFLNSNDHAHGGSGIA